MSPFVDLGAVFIVAGIYYVAVYIFEAL